MASLTVAKGTMYYDADWGTYRECVRNDNYENEDSIRNAIKYITRSRNKDTGESDLLTYGSPGCCSLVEPEDYIAMFEKVQKYVRGDKPIKSRIVHEILVFDDKESYLLSCNMMNMFSCVRKCAEIYYREGFQTVYAIHYGTHNGDIDKKPTKRLHAHFVVNNVNFRTGNVFPTHIASKACTLNGGKTYFRIPFGTKERESEMNGILYEEYLKLLNPYRVDNADDYVRNAYSLYPRNIVAG